MLKSQISNCDLVVTPMTRAWVFVLLPLGPLFAVAAEPATKPATLDAGRPEVVSLLGRPLYAMPAGPERTKLEADLAAARAEVQQHPEDPARIVWLGRRLGYLWRINEAVEVFSAAIKYSDCAPLYRHRGHRFISLRRFDAAITELERAARLIEGRPDEVELDGMPNARNIPLTTTAFNVWYHLGVAHYLKGDFERARRAFEETLKHLGGHDDNLVATSDWLYMTLRRLGDGAEAAKLLEPIRPDMNIIENTAYHRRLLMYQGLLKPADLLDLAKANDLDAATQGYGVGNWYLYNGDKAKAVEVFERVVAGKHWPSFGFIAAEAELARLRTP